VRQVGQANEHCPRTQLAKGGRTQDVGKPPAEQIGHLDVFISEGVFKCAAMQVKGHHIGSRKGALGETRQEEFIDAAGASETNPTLLL